MNLKKKIIAIVLTLFGVLSIGTEFLIYTMNLSDRARFVGLMGHVMKEKKINTFAIMDNNGAIFISKRLTRTLYKAFD